MASEISEPPESILRRFSHATAWVENSLMALLLTAMILLAFAQILLRNVWDIGLSWSDPMLRVMVLWLGLLGAMAATRTREHISIDVLSRFLPPNWKRISQQITDLFSALICALIAYHAYRFVMMEKEDGMIAFANVPAWVCEAILPIGFGVMALRYFFSFVLDLRGQQVTQATEEGSP